MRLDYDGKMPFSDEKVLGKSDGDWDIEEKSGVRKYMQNAESCDNTF